MCVLAHVCVYVSMCICVYAFVCLCICMDLHEHTCVLEEVHVLLNLSLGCVLSDLLWFT